MKPPPSLLERVALDGSHNILEEAHFGVFNGRITAGVPYGDVLSVRGLWAPPYASSDFHLEPRIAGERVRTQRYRWYPTEVRREGMAGRLRVQSTLSLVAGRRAAVLAVQVRNPTRALLEVPLDLHLRGGLDRVPVWEFAQPKADVPTRTSVHGTRILCENDRGALAIDSGSYPWRWREGERIASTRLRVPPASSLWVHLAIAMGPLPEVEADCTSVLSANGPAGAIAEAREQAASRLAEVYRRLPEFEAADPRLEAIYHRSLLHFPLHRWEVPEFVLNPYYGTGSINGGCVGNYLWNFGEGWEIHPLYDPDAVRAHIRQFLRCDLTRHFLFNPMDGQAMGPWYPVNQEKIVGLIYYYVLHTGDTSFLGDTVDGRSVLEWAVFHATYGEDPERPGALFDYGPSNSHLELRRGYPYHHVMPDLNGRRYQNLLWAYQLTEMAGRPATDLRERAAALKQTLKRELWSPEHRWFHFIGGGKKDLRWTIQMFKLVGSGVLDADQEAGLLSHLNEEEFLSDYGIHSLSKQDVAYDQVDIDNGGGGACTCFPPQVVERLHKAGHPREAEDILQRILWWGERMPYWGDSLVANAIDYRKDTPLQCTLDGVTVAQMILFGLFGVRVMPDGGVVVNPHPPSFSPRLRLTGLRLRGHVLDIATGPKEYRVTSGGKTFRAPVGTSTHLPPER